MSRFFGLIGTSSKLLLVEVVLVVVLCTIWISGVAVVVEYPLIPSRYVYYIYVYVCKYIYIYIERERERERDSSSL